MKSLFLALALAGVGSAADFYVSPTGNDANDGTKSKPFQTLEKARDTIRGKGGAVFLLGGEYVLTNTFVLKPEDSGASYEAAPGAPRRLNGLYAFAGLRQATETQRRSTADALARCSLSTSLAAPAVQSAHCSQRRAARQARVARRRAFCRRLFCDYNARERRSASPPRRARRNTYRSPRDDQTDQF